MERNDIAGFVGLGENAGIYVDADNALDFALERCGLKIVNTDAPELPAFLEEFEDWFYSGSWEKEERNDKRIA